MLMMLLPPDVSESVGDGVIGAANSGNDGADAGQFVKCHKRCLGRREALRAGAVVDDSCCVCGLRGESQKGDFNQG